MESKTCTLCLSKLDATNFYAHKKSSDGLMNQCKNCIKQRSRLYHKTNKETISKKAKEYRLNNRDYFNSKNKEWNAKTGYGKKYQQERLKNDVLFKFINRLRTLIRISITKQGFNKKSKAHEILGCDYNKVIEHIESKFEKGMTWKNHGEWHIDHIVPISSATTEKDVMSLNHYTNLQPLWAKENLKKYNKRNNETFGGQDNERDRSIPE